MQLTESQKRALKDEIVDLRMKLIEVGKQANHVIGLLPLKWGLPCKISYNIHKADNELCEIARAMKLDKIDLVKPGRVN